METDEALDLVRWYLELVQKYDVKSFPKDERHLQWLAKEYTRFLDDGTFYPGVDSSENDDWLSLMEGSNRLLRESIPREVCSFLYNWRLYWMEGSEDIKPPQMAKVHYLNVLNAFIPIKLGVRTPLSHFQVIHNISKVYIREEGEMRRKEKKETRRYTRQWMREHPREVEKIGEAKA